MAISTSTPRTASPLPRLEAGDHLDQATFHERYEAMSASSMAGWRVSVLVSATKGCFACLIYLLTRRVNI
jgi:hypothetical protein